MPPVPSACTPCAPWWLRELIYFPTAAAPECTTHLLLEQFNDLLLTEDSVQLITEQCIN